MPIQKATPADVTELTMLVNSAYRGETSKKGWTTEADLLGGIRIDEPNMMAYLQDADTTILKYTNDNGYIVACVYLQVRKDRRLYLGMLTVSPLLQANGIGRQLLYEAETLAKQLDCNMIFMTVISKRHELISWYERRGYKPTGKVLPFPKENAFGDPKQEIEMAVFEKAV